MLKPSNGQRDIKEETRHHSMHLARVTPWASFAACCAAASRPGFAPREKMTARSRGGGGASDLKRVGL